ncbi:MAG: biotin--[acetyl-CoA-carboxylase] ligase [Planctomycetia bacterium]|nr:biotin--[acetyl-CoA-carboxylase] ligase [Planctomycetia bacterium]
MSTPLFATRLDFAEIDSTNRFARRWVGLPSFSWEDLPALIVAQRQTAGEGRQGKCWHSPEGCLMFSVVFSREVMQIPLPKTPLVGLATALAIVDWVRFWLPEPLASKFGIHWPNDVYFLAETGKFQKLSGILVESLASGILITGVGINLHNSVQQAPDFLQSTIVTLADLAPEVGNAHSRETFLETFLEIWWKRIGEIRSDEKKLIQEIDALCTQKNCHVTLHTPRGAVTGFCRGLASDGAILLDGKPYYCGESVEEVSPNTGKSLSNAPLRP